MGDVGRRTRPSSTVCCHYTTIEREAAQLALKLSYNDTTQGGMVNGSQLDPVTFLLAQLAAHAAPLGEETRLQIVGELINLHRNAN